MGGDYCLLIGSILEVLYILRMWTIRESLAFYLVDIGLRDERCCKGYTKVIAVIVCVMR